MRLIGVLDKLGELFIDKRHLLGGAEQTALTYLTELSRRYGHTCVIATAFPVRRRLRYEGLDIESFRDLEELKARMRRIRPHLVLCNLGLVYDAVRIAAGLGLPSFAFLDSYEYCQPSDEEKTAGGLSTARTYAGADEAAFAVRKASKVFVPSRYLQNVIHDRYGIRATVLYPPIAREAVARRPGTPATHGFITGVCGLPHKGAGIFHGLCRAFPNERFLLVGRIAPSFRAAFLNCPNLAIAARLPPAALLERTRLLLVPSQWQEPFGRIAVEAMASGIPVLASQTGGLEEVVGHSTLAVREFRDLEAWRRALGHLLTSATARSHNAAAGRRRSREFTEYDSISRLQASLTATAGRRRSVRTPKRVAIIGSAVNRTAYALINAHLARGLSRRGYEVIDRATATEPAAGAIDWWIHHDYAAELTRVVPPAEGKWVVIRPWDFGPYPRAWVAKLRDECDQLWVPSRWAKRMAQQGGMPPHLIQVMPWGFDEQTFKPQGATYPVPSDKRFKFLFVGAPIHRKGIDVLLKSYRAAFSPADDVCLVLKCHREDIFYDGIQMTDHVRALQGDRSHPAVALVDEFLTSADLASLYRACQVGVFPYRAEGFCLPILEAMACGVPSIVPRFGACLDYCTGGSSFFVPARRISLPVHGRFQFNTLGFEERVDSVDFCEIDPAILAEKLRAVYEAAPSLIAAKARVGALRVRERFTWDDCVARMARELERDRVSAPRRLARARRAQRTGFATFKVARSLMLGR